MKKVIFVLALSSLSFGSFAASVINDNNNVTELNKDGDKKKKKSKKDCCAADKGNKCCEGKSKEVKKDEPAK